MRESRPHRNANRWLKLSVATNFFFGCALVVLLNAHFASVKEGNRQADLNNMLLEELNKSKTELALESARAAEWKADVTAARSRVSSTSAQPNTTGASIVTR